MSASGDPRPISASSLKLLDVDLVEELPPCEGDPGPMVFVHDDACPNYCDYACGGSFFWVQM